MQKHYYKLVVEYDGTAYVGWQSQKNGKSVQEHIEAALSKIFKESTRIIGSGRTDSGVHALGQVASFYTTLVISPQNLQRALNSLLPHTIVIRSVKKMPHEFHALRAAKGKFYRYIILNDSLFPALMQNRAWFVTHDLDLKAIRQAARYLVGRHDFTSFMGAGSSVKDAIRIINSLRVTTSRKDFFGIGKPSSKGKYIIFTFKGEGFVKNQIRNIVGTLIDVGRGKRAATDIPQILQARSRPEAGRMAPARGLYLVKVIY